MKKWLKGNYPIVVLVAIVLSAPILIKMGIKLPSRVNFFQCSGVIVPENILKKERKQFCACVKNVEVGLSKHVVYDQCQNRFSSKINTSFLTKD